MSFGGSENVGSGMFLIERDVVDGDLVSDPIVADTDSKVISILANSYQFIKVIATVECYITTGAGVRNFLHYIKIGASEKTFDYLVEGNVGTGNDSKLSTFDVSYSAALQAGGDIALGVKNTAENQWHYKVKTVHIYGIA